MKKTIKKTLALLVSATLLLTVFCAALPTVSADGEITYTKSFKVNVPYSLTDVNGNASTVKFDVAMDIGNATVGQDLTDHKRIWWDAFIGDAYGYTDKTTDPWTYPDTSIPLRGYTIQKADGNAGASGFATYYSLSAIKDIRFDTSYSLADDLWSSDPLEFFASSDGVNYDKIDTTRTTVGSEFTHPAFPQMYAQIYDTYTFEEADDIHFIRIISTIKSPEEITKGVNRIYAIDYTSFAGSAITYNRSLDVTNPISVTDLDGDSSTVQLSLAASLNNAATGSDYRRIWWGTIVDDPTNWSDTSTTPTTYADTSVPLRGYNVKSADGTKGVSGAVTYYIPSAVKDIRFDNCYIANENWITAPLKFYVSSDGVNFREVEPETTKAGTEFTFAHLLSTNSQIYDEYSFTRADDIHFVRIVSTVKIADNPAITSAINRIYAIDYNGYDDNISYARNLGVTDYYSLTDADGESSTVKFAPADYLEFAAVGLADNIRLFGDNGDLADYGTDKAYTIHKTADDTKGSSGEIVYRFPEVVKNIKFDTSYSTDADFSYASPLEFYASSDGVNYRKLTTERDKVGVELTRDVFHGMNSQIYDTYSFLPTDDIRFIKIVSNINEASEWFTAGVNRIYAIDYNVFEKTVNYIESVDVLNDATVTDLSGESSTVEFGIATDLDSVVAGTDHKRIWFGALIGDAYGYTDKTTDPWTYPDTSIPLAAYTIKNTAGTKDLQNYVKGADGAIVYSFKDAVKEIRFDTSYSTNANFDYASPLEFYASSDGVTYHKLTTVRTLAGTQFTRTGFTEMNSQIFDECSFAEAEDIHYIKIVSNVNENSDYFSGGVNRIYAIDYNIYVDYSLITSGDANGDGNVDILDLVHEKAHLADNTKVLKSFYAADFNRDLIFDVTDLVYLRKAILGIN